jgi:hypothetical protein
MQPRRTVGAFTSEFASSGTDVVNSCLGAVTWTSWWLPVSNWDDGNAADPWNGHALPQALEVEDRPSPERHRWWPSRVGRTAERLKRVKHKLVTSLLVVGAVVVATLAGVTTTARPALAAGGPAWPIDTWGAPRSTDSRILQWDEQLLSAIRAYPAQTGPTITARALGVLHTATYDAWAAYDPTAVGTRPDDGPAQQDASKNTLDNKKAAISYAAARVLNDLFPVPPSCPTPQTTPPKPFCPVAATTNPPSPGYETPDTLLGNLGYPVDTTPASTTDTAATPVGVGNLAAKAVLDFRHKDGSNQLGDDPNGTSGVPYSDNTIPHYKPVKDWWEPTAHGHWQPLCVPLASASLVNGTWTCNSPGKVQQALTPQWKNVTPFGPLQADHYPANFTLPGPPKLADGSYDPTDIDTALRDTSNLTDAQKVKAEYWADGPKTEFPPGHMAVFAQALSRMNAKTLDEDVKLFFVLGNALMDASISAWAAKYQYDFWRPITAIRDRYKDQQVTSWLGPGKGWGHVVGQNWQPYQALTVVTPAFPEYVSGHSTFSAAGRTVLGIFFGTDNFNAKVTIKAGSSKIEPGKTPAKDVVLSWKTLTASADEAGMSRRYGGIHFQTGDEHGRGLGKLIGYNDWNEAQKYFNPTS